MRANDPGDGSLRSPGSGPGTAGRNTDALPASGPNPVRGVADELENLLAAAGVLATDIVASARQHAAAIQASAGDEADHLRMLAARQRAEVVRAATEQAGETGRAAARDAGEVIRHARLDVAAATAAAAGAIDQIRAAAARELAEAESTRRAAALQRVRIDDHRATMVGALRAAAAGLLTTTIDAPAAAPLVAPAPPAEPPVRTTEAEEAPGDTEVPDTEVADTEVPAAVPSLVPVLGFRDELRLRLLAASGVAGTAWFWLWWVSAGHGTWDIPTVLVTGLLAWIYVLPLYFFFFVCRMTRPNPNVAIPDLRVAMVVTKAPSEPWPVLQRTLRAALDQEFPHPYDVWLADERPTEETLRWCAGRGIKVCTRHGVAPYHRATWPRRTRSKEGNLAYFYDTVGYARYDVVAQLDADHIPTSTYLAAMTRPFADPAVGYVAAPSICDANLADGWTVKGRLYREASMHGPVQSGSNGGFAPVCIGSHYAVRTAALAAAGGVGPDLAEDYTTSLWLLSTGWEGVFSIDAEAHGDGPASAEEMLVQELQWSRSLGTIFVKWAPPRLRTVPWRARIRLGFALLFYPVQGMALTAAALLPVVGLLLGVTWGHTSLLGFYVHLWPTSIVGLAVAVLLRRRRLLRPPDARLWSWELALFQMLRWPWALIGFFQGMYAGARSKVTSFKVTPKSETGSKPLQPRFLAPALVLGAIPGWAVAVAGRPGRTTGLMVLCSVEAVSYLLCASLAVGLHLAANRRRLTRAGEVETQSPWAMGRTAAAVTWSVAGVTILAMIWRYVHLG